MKYTKKNQKKRLKKFVTMLAFAFAVNFYSSDAKNALTSQESIDEHQIRNEANSFYQQRFLLTMPIFGGSKEFLIKVILKKEKAERNEKQTVKR